MPKRDIIFEIMGLSNKVSSVRDVIDVKKKLFPLFTYKLYLKLPDAHPLRRTVTYNEKTGTTFLQYFANKMKSDNKCPWLFVYLIDENNDKQLDNNEWVMYAATDSPDPRPLWVFKELTRGTYETPRLARDDYSQTVELSRAILKFHSLEYEDKIISPSANAKKSAQTLYQLCDSLQENTDKNIFLLNIVMHLEEILSSLKFKEAAIGNSENGDLMMSGEEKGCQQVKLQQLYTTYCLYDANTEFTSRKSKSDSQMTEAFNYLAITLKIKPHLYSADNNNHTNEIFHRTFNPVSMIISKMFCDVMNKVEAQDAQAHTYIAHFDRLLSMQNDSDIEDNLSTWKKDASDFNMYYKKYANKMTGDELTSSRNFREKIKNAMPLSQASNTNQSASSSSSSSSSMLVRFMASINGSSRTGYDSIPEGETPISAASNTFSKKTS